MRITCSALQCPGEPRFGVEVDLVDDRPGDRHAVAFEERRVEHDLVDRPSDAALALREIELCSLRVAVSHNFTVLSLLPLTISFASGLKATELTTSA